MKVMGFSIQCNYEYKCKVDVLRLCLRMLIRIRILIFQKKKPNPISWYMQHHWSANFVYHGKIARVAQEIFSIQFRCVVNFFIVIFH